MSSPYANLPTESFWRPAVADRHYLDFEQVAVGPFFRPDDRIATAGSCFAQHIGYRLRERGLGFLDLERATAGFKPDQANRHGFGQFSCRFGNIYTVRQLLQVTQEALGLRKPVDGIWTRNSRFYDAMRPGVDPVGHATAEDVIALRTQHLGRVRQLFRRMSLFVFTLGLTEAWESLEDGTVYPTAPGTIAGSFEENKYGFRNFRYIQILEDFEEFWELLRGINPGARMVLTVSPVPLTATASGEHVLVATTQSKATLRALAGDLASWERDISYFPSYELISSHPMRAAFFNPDLRTVNKAGVDYVMSHFFQSGNHESPDAGTSSIQVDDGLDLICDDQLLDQFAK